MSYIKAHPLALLNYHSQSPEIKEEIDKISIGYDDKVKFFVDKLIFFRASRPEKRNHVRNKNH